MKQKRKAKNTPRLSKHRLWAVGIGLLLILVLAIANMAFLMQNRHDTSGQTALPIMTNATVAYFISESETQSAIEASLTAEAP